MAKNKKVITFDLFPELLSDWEKEWQDMPEFVQNDEFAFRSIKIHFQNIEDIQKFAKLINQTIGPKTKYIWYPEVVNFPNRHYRYIDEK